MEEEKDVDGGESVIEVLGRHLRETSRGQLTPPPRWAE